MKDAAEPNDESLDPRVGLLLERVEVLLEDEKRLRAAAQEARRAATAAETHAEAAELRAQAEQALREAAESRAAAAKLEAEAIGIRVAEEHEEEEEEEESYEEEDEYEDEAVSGTPFVEPEPDPGITFAVYPGRAEPDPSAPETAPRASVESTLGEAFLLGRLSAWTQGPLDSIVALTGRLRHLPDLDRRLEIEKMLDAATATVVLRRSSWAWRQRFSDWWNGTRIEAAATLLDEAAIRFVEHADAEGLRLAVDDAVGYAETLPTDDLMRVRFETTLANLDAITLPGVEGRDPVPTTLSREGYAD